MARTRTEGTMERLCLDRKKILSCRKGNLRMSKNIANMKFEHRSSEVAWRSPGHNRKYWKVAEPPPVPFPKADSEKKTHWKDGTARVLMGTRLQPDGITGRGK